MTSETPSTSSSTTSSAASHSPPWTSKATRYFEQLGKLNVLGKVLALDHLRQHSQRQQRLQAAEEHAAAKSMGWQLDPSSLNPQPSTDTMGTTILGDVHQPPTIVMPPQPPQRSLLPLVLTAAAALGVPAAGAVGFGLALLMSRTPAAPKAPAPAADVVIEQSGESIDIGLLKYDDLLKRLQERQQE